MKNFKYKSLLIMAFSALVMWNCSDDDKLPVDFDELQVSGGAFATEIGSEGLTNINKLDPGTSTFSKSYQLITPNGGTDISRIDVYVSYTGLNASADEALLTTINSDSFTNTGEYPEVLVSINGADILSALGVSPTVLEGGDTFDFRLAVTNPNGTFTDVSANFDNQSADHTFAATVVCELPEVPAGDWIVQMGDSYGDGWQTTSGNGGPGITITLNDGTVLEVGLCTPYEANSFPCVNESSAGSDTVTIPPGTTSAEWFFPGDFWGEISFTIQAPSGNVVASYTPGSPAGPIPLNLCNE
ncbi:hypothetical protein [Aquimarina sp. 2201CG14-23]|uniref:hypothetical protein n=1 Tax=Aquimarina mycalae TaxID=3040073 RepID=UPI0024780A0C|nr:hypothetical protein [Aquimarina sp. 2201CG14-23]MDH7444777.1 hypothetical protein [Aquimarina sp. 2201CG14-23]